MPVEGKCGLCHKNTSLVISHAIPKALYRLCRAEEDKNPHPVVVSHSAHMRSSHQIKDHFLCEECEQRLHQRGEDWVMRNCYRGRGKFLLRDDLAKATPYLTVDGTSVYTGATVAGVDVAALTYFPTSVFWRASARWWNIGRTKMPPTELGPYQEEIRLYLLDQGPFPQRAALNVLVSTKDVPLLAAHFPLSERADRLIRHRLWVPGIQFLLALGKEVDDQLRTGCIAHGKDNPIFTSDAADVVIVKRFRDMLVAHAET